MKRILLRSLVVIAAAVAVAYGFDCVYARVRRAPFADVKIDRVLAVAEKFNKIDYMRTSPVTERCVYSLFPQFGNDPCWYVMRHTFRIVKVGW